VQSAPLSFWEQNRGVITLTAQTHWPTLLYIDEEEATTMAGAGRNYANLDALIPRADLFEDADPVIADSQVIRIPDLKPGVIYDMLRKPDFQRETINWTPKQVAGLIETASKSEIIPAIILWQNGNKIFVVDGAHRLSALIAWAWDDYGAGKLSQRFFQGKIHDHQIEMDRVTRELVEERVGTWTTHEARGSMLNMKAIPVQWIGNSKAEDAAEAFIRINEGGTVIDPLEVRILKAKRSALSIATRIIANGGRGHEYWRHFSSDTARNRAPKLGAEIHKLLYHPPLEIPIKTMDVPLAGFGYGAGTVRFAFDLVGLVNELPVPDSTRSKGGLVALPDDESGAETIRYLQNVRRAVRLVLSNEAMSLGLHPALYFYTAGGTFQPAALHNMLVWVLDLEKRRKLQQFLDVRGAFEALMLAHPVVIKPETHALGSGARTRSRMLTILNRLLDLFSKSPNPARAWKHLTGEFPQLLADEAAELEKAKKGAGGARFSRGAKSAGYLADLPTVPKCALCGGLLHRNGRVTDHKSERRVGGSSARINAQGAHPACNSNRQKSDEQKERKAG
jgi:hypothetical protein